MTNYPTKEDEIVGLAIRVAAGLEENPDLFPNPPVSVKDLKQITDDFEKQSDVSMAAHAAAKTERELKDDKLLTLLEGIKKVIRYAENAVDFDDASLKKIGWHGRKKPAQIKPPGACSNLRISKRGEGGNVTFVCNKLTDGGKPGVFTLERRESPDGPWSIAATSFTNEVVVKHQPRGVKLDYRITASNTAGKGAPSNTVTVTL